MPFPQPSLTELKQQVAQDIAAGLPGTDALLRFSNLKILGDANANLFKLNYGYLDYIALQSNPFTATGEALEAWAALRQVYRKPATQAGDRLDTGDQDFGVVKFSGTPTAFVPENSLVVRGDGVQFNTQTGATIGGDGFGYATLVAYPDPNGKLGAFGNTDVGVTLVLGNAVANVQSKAVVFIAIIGGADIETDDSLRTRMLAAYQTIPGSGSAADYVSWALETPGVTRAWVNPNGMGSGTVIVYTMLDQVRSAQSGFPQGSNGTATAESRDTHATGDQLLVANQIYPHQPATPLVYSCAPIAEYRNIRISGLLGASTATKDAIEAAVVDAFFRKSVPGGVYVAPNSGLIAGQVNVSDIEEAISSVPNTTGFVLVNPPNNMTTTDGYLLLPELPIEYVA